MRILLLILLLFLSVPSSLSAEQNQTYDVIVVGGEPEGIAAAVSAARNGAKTLLIEKRDGLGGLMTYGDLNFLDLAREKNDLFTNAGIFEEWHHMVGNGVVFDINQAKEAFKQLVTNEKNISLKLNTKVVSAIKEGDTVSGVVTKDNQGNERSFYGKRIIDCTQDGDFAALAGAPFFVGGEDIGLKDRNMSVTLMMHFTNINWDEIKKAAESGKFGPAHIGDNQAWGFGQIRNLYKPVEDETRVRGLNIARQKDGSIYINALQIFGVDGLSEASKQAAIEKGKRETEHFLAYLNKEFPGFENATIADFPSELYVRETRHFYAEYQLPMSDVWENKDHWDRIALSGYPVDVQATSIHDYGYVIAAPKQYSIPFRSMVPKKIDHLLIASRASGYSSLAAGSARVLPTGMSVGEAAGAAAKLSIDNQIDFRVMSKNHFLIEKLQGMLLKQGDLLYPYTLPYPYEYQPYYPALKRLINEGLLSGGYDNDLQMNQPMSEREFFDLLGSGLSRLNLKVYQPIRAEFEVMRMQASTTTPLTQEKASKWIQHFFPTLDMKLNLKYDPVLRSEGYPLIDSILEHYHPSSTKVDDKPVSAVVMKSEAPTSSLPKFTVKPENNNTTWIAELLSFSAKWIDVLRLLWIDDPSMAS